MKAQRKRRKLSCGNRSTVQASSAAARLQQADYANESVNDPRESHDWCSE